MNLTTLARVKAGLVGMLTSTQHDAYLKGLIISVSARIEQYLDRHIQRMARTEYYDAALDQKAWYLKGYPVASTPAAVIYYDTARGFTGTAQDASTYFIDTSTGRLRFDDAPNQERDLWPGSIKAVYTGGMAPDLDKLTMTLTGIAGVFTPGEVVTGGTSGATGTVVSIVLGVPVTTGTIVITVTGGTDKFQAAETITAAGGATATTNLLTYEPLVSLYPAVVEAANQQVAFLFQRKDSLGTTNISTEGGSIGMETPVQITRMVKELLAPYRRMLP